MNYFPYPHALLALMLTFSHSIAAQTALTEKALHENQTQHSHNLARESGFTQTEDELKALKASLAQQRDELKKHNDSLASTFSRNEDALARLEEKLRLETGSLGEVFGVVRQNAKELQGELENSVTSAGAQSYNQTIADITAATALPSMAQLTTLWHALDEQIKASGQISPTTVSFINGAGETQHLEAIRLGSFGLVSEHGYLSWNALKQEARAYLKQPDFGPTYSTLTPVVNGQTQPTVVDPSRGVMLEQLALTPSLSDRIKAGGVVGKIILSLLAIGLLIALVRGVTLLVTGHKIRSQLKQPSKPGHNPLGRILAVYDPAKTRSVEALELRLLEAVVDEQASLERGLSMLKLLAALAPMLGLLGTVTGMIETFQVITQFGNGDPKVMAGGISMALVTTVLGLIAAMPLLLAHNILSSQAEHIRTILEKQGIALVAQQAEKDTSAHNQHNNALPTEQAA